MAELSKNFKPVCLRYSEISCDDIPGADETWLTLQCECGFTLSYRRISKTFTPGNTFEMSFELTHYQSNGIDFFGCPLWGK